MLARIRAFLDSRGIIEVDTPVLARSVSSEPHIEPFQLDESEQVFYLQSSPEHAMKRLLAAHSAPIYQLGKVFRAGECGSRHNPEFTMLEWYRPRFSLDQLIQEVADLIYENLALNRPMRRRSYRRAFMDILNVDPFRCGVGELQHAARECLDARFDESSCDFWLQLLFAHVVEPRLGLDGLECIVDYPPEQAAMAELGVDAEGNRVARRFEIYAGGVELANGYQELRDARELRLRIEKDLALRSELGKRVLPIDESLLAALESGVPPCAGVALGVDRLLMLFEGVETIDEVLPFSFDRI